MKFYTYYTEKTGIYYDLKKNFIILHTYKYQSRWCIIFEFFNWPMQDQTYVIGLSSELEKRLLKRDNSCLTYLMFVVT